MFNLPDRYQHRQRKHKKHQNSDNYPDIFFFYCNNVISYIELLEIHSSGIYLLFNEVLRLGVISAFVRDSANRCKNASISALNFAPTWPSYSFHVGVIRAIVTGAGNRLFDAPQWQERCQALQENSSSSFIRPILNMQTFVSIKFSASAHSAKFINHISAKFALKTKLAILGTMAKTSHTI